MKLKKRALSAIMATIMAVMPLSQVWITADAYEEPTDIKITVQTKDIDIDEIPEDRKVQLEVYTENCPPFTILSLYFEKDSRLEYDDWLSFTLSDELKKSWNVGMNVLLGSGDCPNYIGCSIGDMENIDFNGVIYKINLTLPEEVHEGDFFKLDLVRSYYDRKNLKVGIALGDDFDSYFFDTPFSELNNGGIRITQDSPPPTEPPKTEPPRTEPPKQDNPPSNNGNGNNNNNNSGNGGSQNNTGNNNNSDNNNNNNKSDKKTVTSVVTTSKQTTPTTSKSSTTERTTTITDTTEQTTSAESTTQTQPVITGMEENPPKKNKNGLFMFLIINGLIITMGGGVFIYNKVKKVK